MTREFKKGDKIKIKGSHYVGDTLATLFTSKMRNYCDRETYISSVSQGMGGTKYHLNIDRGSWFWEGIWLELVKD